MDEFFKKLAGKFGISGEVVYCEKKVTGLINETYKVGFSYDENENKAFLFQKLNKNAFSDISGVMSNIYKVTSHLKRKCPDEKTLDFYISEAGVNYYEYDDGSIWRAADWIDSVTYTGTEDISVIREAGRAYGRFLKCLSDLDILTLKNTIPDFHNTKKIIERFEKIFCSLDAEERKKAAGEADFILSNKELFTSVIKKYESGILPIRVVHNDTKLSNILFSPSEKKAVAVIDLDTVMPGMAVYDFGDAIRSVTCSSDLSKPSLYKIKADPSKYMAFSEGYLSEAGDILTTEEKFSLHTAAFSVTAELACRYFTDYFTHQNYFALPPSALLTKALNLTSLTRSLLTSPSLISEVAVQT